MSLGTSAVYPVWSLVYPGDPPWDPHGTPGDHPGYTARSPCSPTHPGEPSPRAGQQRLGSDLLIRADWPASGQPAQPGGRPRTVPASRLASRLAAWSRG